MLITKIDGTQEEFNPEKLRRSLKRSGATPEVVSDILNHIQGELEQGMSTSYIYRHALKILKKRLDTPAAARYSLRRAMMDLGPSGYPFEQFLAEILKQKGYTVKIGVELQGKCVAHEVDVLAYNDTELIVIEAKYHNRQSYKSDVKVPLYVHSRFLDLQGTQFDGHLKEGQKAQCWIATNTKFTHSAIQYGRCVGLNLVSWNYPDDGSVQDLIEQTGLHPLTCLTQLTKKQKDVLMRRGTVLCRSIKENPTILHKAGIKGDKTDAVLEEAQRLCVPRG